jgi:hypothetical protein
MKGHDKSRIGRIDLSGRSIDPDFLRDQAAHARSVFMWTLYRRLLAALPRAPSAVSRALARSSKTGGLRSTRAA